MGGPSNSRSILAKRFQNAVTEGQWFLGTMSSYLWCDDSAV